MTVVPLPPRIRQTIIRTPARRGKQRAILAQWLRLPRSVRTPDYASIRYWDRPGCADRDDRAPVLLVHGYAGTEHIWGPLRAALTASGFDCLIALRYNAFRCDIHQVADWLVDRAERTMEVTGATGVHLIGHSLGGLVVRDAVQLRGLGRRARTAVTIATPHQGSSLARLVPGPAARQMRPGSDFLAELDRAPRPEVARRIPAGHDLSGDSSSQGLGTAGPHTRWLVCHGTGDRVVRGAPSRLPSVPDDILSIRTARAGHGSISGNSHVVDVVAEHLVLSEISSRATSLHER